MLIGRTNGSNILLRHGRERVHKLTSPRTCTGIFAASRTTHIHRYRQREASITYESNCNLSFNAKSNALHSFIYKLDMTPSRPQPCLLPDQTYRSSTVQRKVKASSSQSTHLLLAGTSIQTTASVTWTLDMHVQMPR